MAHGEHMYFKFGDFTHPDAEVLLKRVSQVRRYVRGKHLLTKKTMDITGVLKASTEAAIKTAIEALEDGYDQSTADGGLYQDAGLYHTDGTVSAHFFDASETIGGVRVVYLDFPDSDPGEYANGRTFAIRLEADFHNSSTEIMFWREVITFWGGGSRRRWIETRRGAPVLQTVNQRTTYKATQSGKAFGFSGYPLEPPPYFIVNINHVDRNRLRLIGPEKFGSEDRIFGTEWFYPYESSLPIGIAPLTHV